jgi:hypothetical protein
MTFVLLDETRATTIDAAVTPDGVRVPVAAIRDALGWEAKPEGLCRSDECRPLAPGALDARGIDLAALAAALDRPLALDAAERAACLGAPAAARASRLRSLDAPDFTLPDVEGRPYSLSGFRGKKVFLVAWASW